MTYWLSPKTVRRRGQQGISLIEAMVGMVVGLVASLVIMQSFSSSEVYKRNLAGTADAVQTASIAGAHLDMLLQEAGASLVQGRNVWGCRLVVKRSGADIVPRSSAYPAPFDGFPTAVRVLPLGIWSGGAGSDVVMVMIGNSPTGNRDMPFTATADGLTMTLTNTNGIGLKNAGMTVSDMFLTVPQEVASAPGDCQIVQTTTFPTATAVADVSLGGKVMPASSTSIPLTSPYGALLSAANTPSAFHLGRESSVKLSLLSVNGNGELVELDMLGRVGTQTFGENVLLLKALYGLDNGNGGTANDNVIDEWVSPAESGWTITSLMDGKASTEQKVDQIKAIRIALVTRSSQVVNSDAKTTKLVLFSDLAEARQVVRDLSTDEQKYQYQVFDWVIPLRNMKAIPKS